MAEAENQTLLVLKDIQSRLANIETTLSEMRTEMDGQFQLMMSRGSKADGLEIIVAAHGKRLTKLEALAR